jgi:hypothetical protein
MICSSITKTIYPTHIVLKKDTNVLIMTLSDNNLEKMYVNALPSNYEPSRVKKVGRCFINSLVEYMGTRYAQIRKMSPALSKQIDLARKSESLTGSLLCIVNGNIHINLLEYLSGPICQTIRKNYCEWSGSETFHPNGYMYVSWLTGRLFLSGGENSRMLSLFIRRVILLQSTAHAFNV